MVHSDYGDFALWYSWSTKIGDTNQQVNEIISCIEKGRVAYMDIQPGPISPAGTVTIIVDDPSGQNTVEANVTDIDAFRS